MNKRTSLRVTVSLAAALALAMAAGCGAPSATSTTTDGKALVNEQCGRCHPLERVSGVTKDQSGWTATVGRMRTNGLTVTDEQAAAIVKYLTERDAAK
jgi:mono/diheme cytochrome c family protein